LIDTNLRQSIKVLITAKTRVGKTRLSKKIIKKTANKYPGVRWFIFDRTEEFLQYRLVGKKVRHYEFSLPYQDSDIHLLPESVDKELGKTYFSKRFHIFKGNHTIDTFLETCKSWGGCVVVIDEFQNFATSTSLHPILKEFVEQGAHNPGRYGHVSLFLTTKRVSGTNLNTLSNVNRFFAMRASLHKDIKRINDEIVHSPDEKGFIDEIQNLKIGEYLPFIDNTPYSEAINKPEFNDATLSKDPEIIDGFGLPLNPGKKEGTRQLSDLTLILIFCSLLLFSFTFYNYFWPFFKTVPPFNWVDNLFLSLSPNA
jgi:AAA+ ATPase superfamily predicted ATPase